MFISQQVVQVHGGTGMTIVLDVGHDFKRLPAINVKFDTPDHHLGRYRHVT